MAATGIILEMGGKEGVFWYIQEYRGNVSAMARAMGCHRASILRIIREDPDLQEALEDARANAVDEVEEALVENALKGNVVAQIFYLKTQGHRVGRPFIEGKPSDLIPEQETVENSLDAWKAQREQQQNNVAAMLEDFAIEADFSESKDEEEDGDRKVSEFPSEAGGVEIESEAEVVEDTEL